MIQDPPTSALKESESAERVAKTRFIRRMFDTIAPDYDRLNTWVSMGMDRRWRRRAVRQMPSEGLIVDWCSGTGDMVAEYLKRPGNLGRVVMCDFSTEMRLLADSKIGPAGAGRSWYVCCDVTRSPFRDRVFDGQMQGFAIRNLFNRPAFFAEASRTTASFGVGALLDLSTPRNRIWRAICNLHFRIIAPRLVALVAGRGVFAYRYLSESVEHNATAEQVTGEMASAGLKDARYEPLAGGIGALFIWGPGK